MLVPLSKACDISEWLWIEAESFHHGEVEFLIPEHIGPYVPYNAGRAFHLPLQRILDYLHGRADRTKVGGETDHFQQTKPRARLRTR